MASSLVLVIENDQATSAALRDALSAAGATVRVVPDGETGLTIAETEQPRLIVLSVELPGISGYSVCKNLRRSAATSQIPIFLMSTTATEEIFAQHKRLPTRATEYFTKPLNAKALVDAARPLLPASSDDDLVGLIEDEIAQALSDDLFAPEGAPARVDRGASQTPIAAALSIEAARATRPTLEAQAANAPIAGHASVAPTSAAPATDGRLEGLESELADLSARLDVALIDAVSARRDASAAEHRAAQAELRATAAEARLHELDASRRSADSTSTTSARELLQVREVLNGKEREILALRDEIFHRDHKLLEFEEAQASQHARFDALVEASEAAERRVAELTTDADIARQRVAELERDGGAATAAAEAARADAAALAAHVDALQRRTDAVAAELAAAQEALEAAIEAGAATAQARDQATAALGEAAQAREALASELGSRAAELAQAVASLDRVSTARDALGGALEASHAELAQAKAALAEAATNRDALDAQLQATLADLGRLAGDLESARSQSAELRVELDRVGARESELTERLAERDRAVAALNEQLAERAASEAAAAERARAVEATLESARAESNALTGQRDDARGRAERVEVELVAAQTAASALRAELAQERHSAQATRSQLEARIAELERALHDAQESALHVRRALGQQVARVVDVAHQLDADRASVRAAAIAREEQLLAAYDELSIHVLELRSGYDAKLAAAERTIDALGVDVGSLAAHRRELRAALERVHETIGGVAAALGVVVAATPPPDGPEPTAAEPLRAYAEAATPELSLAPVPAGSIAALRAIEVPENDVADLAVGSAGVWTVADTSVRAGGAAGPASVASAEASAEPATVEQPEGDGFEPQPEAETAADPMPSTPRPPADPDSESPLDAASHIASEGAAEDDRGDAHTAPPDDGDPGDGVPSREENSGSASVHPFLVDALGGGAEGSGESEGAGGLDSAAGEEGGALVDDEPGRPHGSSSDSGDFVVVDSAVHDQFDVPPRAVTTGAVDALISDLVEHEERRESMSRSISESGPSLATVGRRDAGDSGFFDEYGDPKPHKIGGAPALGPGAGSGAAESDTPAGRRSPSESDGGDQPDELVTVDESELVEDESDLTDLDPASIEVDTDEIDEDDFV